uniref:U6 snRNA-associated Sm-like protein LSm1 n=1 Tax=Syphacia muris TaxID=451379 RepID=A0A0N5AA20_9BILA
MDLPDPYLPGAISLLDQLDKKLLVVLRDGRTLIGYLRTIDQFANLVLHETLERIYVDKFYGDIHRGIFLIRGENVVLAGEIDEEKDKNTGLTSVSVDEILSLQREKTEEKERFEEARNRAMRGRGKVSSRQCEMLLDDP